MVRLRQSTTQDHVSYDEPWSQEDDDDDDFHAVDSDAGYTISRDREPPRNAGARGSSRLRRRPSVHHSESSEHDEPDRSISASEASAQVPAGRSNVRTPRRTKNPPLRPGKPSKDHKTPRKKTAVLNLDKPEPTLLTDSNTPPWQSLPYGVLLDVFVFAYSEMAQLDLEQAADWLVGAARTCRAFSEPALTALYRSPPLLRAKQMHSFHDAISSSSCLFNYAVKVRRLEPKSMSLVYSAPRRGRIDLGALVSKLSKLSSIYIGCGIVPTTSSSLRLGNSPRNWSYPRELFDALEEGALRLNEWCWNGDFLSGSMDLPWLKEVHESPTFKGLRHVTFERFDGVRDIPETLIPLKNLNALTIISCPLWHDDPAKVSLPMGLEHLSIMASMARSLPFARSLSEHGKQIKSLTLRDNIVMNLTFLSRLKTACPNLEKLNLYYTFVEKLARAYTRPSQTAASEDATPTWPSTLQELELINLKWPKADDAENFLNSLVMAAAELPDLRVLVLKATVDMGWRQRAVFRDKWTALLERVFLREPPKPPSPHLMSFAAFRAWKEHENAQQDRKPSPSPRGPVPILEPSSALQKRKRSMADRSDQHQERKLRTRHSAGKSSDAIADQHNPITAVPPKESTSDVDDVYVQGLCRIVDVRIDNHRPAADQFTVGDFVDTSGDEGSDFTE